MRIGDGIFLLLLKMIYEKKYENENESKKMKQAALTITRRLMTDSSDGEDAVKTYWIEHAKNKETKQAGENLINSTHAELPFPNNTNTKT